MAEYIEKNATIAKLTALEVAEPLATMTDAKLVLADMPVVDVVPVVRGEWIRDDDSYYVDGYASYYDFQCSVCGEMVTDRHGLPRYCPWCGAKMEGSNDN